MSNLGVRKIVLFILLVIPGFTGITLFATPVAVDSAHVLVRRPNSQFVESYKLQEDFNYTPPPVKTNFLQQLIDYLRKRFKNWDDFVAKMPFVLKVMLWGAILFCLYIVITKTKLYQIFYSDKSTTVPEYHFTSGEHLSIDYDTEISSRVEQQQYRMAVRLLFLKVIHVLRNKELIQYSKDKTNFDYYHDLSNNELKSSFFSITQIFNHVWYGDVEIEKEQYLRFEKSFQTFYNAIDVQE